MEQVTRICKYDGSETTEPLQTAAKRIAEHFEQSEQWAIDWLRSGNGVQTDFAFYELTPHKAE